MTVISKEKGCRLDKIGGCEYERQSMYFNG